MTRPESSLKWGPNESVAMNLYGLAQITREMGLGGARKLKHEGSLEDVRANDLVLRCSQKVGEAKHNTCRSANAFRAIHSIKS